jgi:hypothetical protein
VLDAAAPEVEAAEPVLETEPASEEPDDEQHSAKPS